MKQADVGLNLTFRRTRKRGLLAHVERVVPWAALAELVIQYPPDGKRGSQTLPVQTMLRSRFMQPWITISDPATEDMLHNTPLFRA